ncbi:MAG: tetratricopeptide repeat protein [Promethearchaeota archaeon]
MNLTNLRIRDFFTKDAKLTFLVGAGCSVDSPSNLPAGNKMMKILINYTCAESEIDAILEVKDLRFEQLVEIIRDRLDRKLKIIDYYELCDKPNFQHFFLTEMIKKGHFVMTTNFDCLIELAMIQSGIPKKKITPIITKKDFQKFNNPFKFLENDLKFVYKIHGSPKNIMTGKVTKDSLITTIQAFGSNKEGLNVFQIEPFKQPLVKNISEDRSLVVIGYSGSDDFDIVPTLKVLENLKELIWINYVVDDGGIEKIYEINSNNIEVLNKFDKINQILLEIHKTNNIPHIYRVDVNTTRMINELLEIKPIIDLENFNVDPIDFLKNNIEKPDNIIKNYIPYKIYFDFNLYNEAVKCSEEILRIAEKSNNKKWKSVALNNIGEVFRAQGKFDEALKYFKEAWQITEQLDDSTNKSTILNNFSEILREQGKYDEALKYFEYSLNFKKRLEDPFGKALLLNNIGLIYKSQGNFPEALKRFEKALKIFEKLGDLLSKATLINNIADIYRVQANFQDALKRYNEALKIVSELGDLSKKADTINNIAMIHYSCGNYNEALKLFKEALEIDDKLNNLTGKGTRLNNIGLVYDALENYSEAMIFYEQALKIADQQGNLSGKISRLNNIASIHYIQGNFDDALKLYNEALLIAEDLGDQVNKSAIINNLGIIYDEMENYQEALKCYEEALKISEVLGDPINRATTINNIALIYQAMGNYEEALKMLESLLGIFNQLGLENSQNAEIVKENIESLKKKMI